MTLQYLAQPAGRACACTLLFAGILGAGGESSDKLLIGISGSLSGGTSSSKEASTLATLKDFIRDETGMKDEIVPNKDWQELAKKMANKEIPIGVFQGYEFAWASSEYPQLKPLAAAINGAPSQVAYVVTRKNGVPSQFSDLRGQAFGLAFATGLPWFFVQRQCEALGSKPEAFFSHMQRYDNMEDAIDDVVDGKTAATVADRRDLEAYKRRKPGRFQKLKELVRSESVVAPVVAYVTGALKERVIERFRSGLYRANQNERGQMLLALFHLTKFEAPPADFERNLEKTRKAYPPPASSK